MTDAILTTLACVADRILHTAIPDFTICGTTLSGIKPLFVSILHRENVQYAAMVLNGHLVSPAGEMKQDARASLVRCYGGELDFLGQSVALLNSLPATSKGMEKIMLGPNVSSAIYGSIQSHLLNKQSAFGFADDHLNILRLSKEQAAVHEFPARFVKPDVKTWVAQAEELTEKLSAQPGVIQAKMSYQAFHGKQRIVTSEGTRLLLPREIGVSSLELSVLTEKSERYTIGLPIYRNKAQRVVEDFSLYGDPAFLQKKLDVASLEELIVYMRKAVHAPSGQRDVVLDPHAFGVLLHEGILAHLVSLSYLLQGYNNTFQPKRIGERILPECLTVIDDPLVSKNLLGEEGLGSYPYDDEGVLPQRVTIVEKGLFKGGYLSDRESAGLAPKMYPELAITGSNGHARIGALTIDEEGKPITPEPRISNLIAIPETYGVECVQDLVENLKAKNGLYVMGGGGMVDVETGNFIMDPNVVWEYTKKGKTLLNGAFLPLNALATEYIKTVSKETAVNSGLCGAVSGFVPTTETTPGAYLARVAVQLQTPEPVQKNLFKEAGT
ncbi:MAG: TldD/PmbA family protein [archaeon]